MRLLTYPASPGGAVGGTQVSGTLVEQDTCLYVQSGTMRFAPVFPAGRATYDTVRRTLRFAGRDYSVGGAIALGGTTIIGRGATAVEGRGCDVSNVVIVISANG